MAIKKININGVEHELQTTIANIDNLQASLDALEVTASNKMDKVNPEGSGTFSFGREDGSTVGQRSIVLGSNATASGKDAIAIGRKGNATGNYATSIGYGNTVSSDNGVAIGVNSQATNGNSISIGSGNTSEGWNSTVLGANNTASGGNSVAIGVGSVASGEKSVALGDHNTASGEYATAMGCWTKSPGCAAIALGNGSTSNGWAAMASGIVTSAQGLGQHVFGSYNIPDSDTIENYYDSSEHLIIVGNGDVLSDNGVQSNAHTLDWSGNAWFAGDVYVGSTSGTNKDSGSKMLATVEQVQAKADAAHNHDEDYDALGAANTALASAKSYTDTKTSSLASTSAVDTKISAHNTSTSAHSDIRDLITSLTTKLNNFLDVDDTTTDQLSEVLTLINNNKGTLESLTTSKINVSAIVDNLTTNSTDKVLSAAQGVVIKSLIDALQTELDSHTHSISDVSGLQTALDGKAATSHGTHVTYSTTAPVMDGTASTGSASTVARSDHKHPTDTSRAAQTDLDALKTTVASKANSSHTHDDRYYTESEIDTKVSSLQSSINGKAASSHTHDYLPLTGGTVSGELKVKNIVMNEANDNYGLIPATNNYGTIGTSSKKWYKIYGNLIYKNGTEISNLYAPKYYYGTSGDCIAGDSLDSGVLYFIMD